MAQALHTPVVNPLAGLDHQLPVDDGELMLLVTGRLEAAGLDQRKLPAALLPTTGLAEARFVRGPNPDLPLPEPPVDAAAWSPGRGPAPRWTCPTTAPPPTRCVKGCNGAVALSDRRTR